MRYLGGKMRQSKIIAAHCTGQFAYVEPFCGAMWSAVASIKLNNNREFWLSDANPYLMTFWAAVIKEGWNPPASPTEDDWRWYNKNRPIDDPMTGYLGFAWSFGGKFFGGAARSNGNFQGSHSSTMAKIKILRTADVKLQCGSFDEVNRPRHAATYYLDPPYENRTHQFKGSSQFDYGKFRAWASRLAQKNTVLTTGFETYGWDVVHDFGDTVVRHLNAKPKDGTREFLLKVKP